MQKFKTYIIPLTLFILSFFLRVLLVSKGPYSGDCLYLAIQAQKTLQTLQLQPLFGFGYPLTVILGATFIGIFKLFLIDDPVIAVNFMSVVFSSLSIPIFYLIVQKLFNARTAFFSATLFSVSPIFLGISVYGKSHAPSILFLLLTVEILLKYLKKNRLRYLFISSICMGFMGATRLQDMVLVMPSLCYLYYILSKDIPKNKNKYLFLFVIVAGIVTLIFHLPFLFSENLSSFRHQFDRFWSSGVTHNFQGLVSASLSLTIKLFIQNFSLFGLLVVFLGGGFLCKNNLKIFIFLFVWLTGPLVFYGNLSTTAPRFFAVALPPFFVFQGFLLDKLFNINFRFQIVSVIAYVTLFVITATSIMPILSFRHRNALLPEYAQWVAEKTEKNAQIITTDDRFFIQYYGKRKTLSRPLKSVNFTDEELSSFQKTLNDILKQNIPVYITYIGIYDYDPKKKFSTFLIENYHLKLIGKSLYEDWHQGELTKKVFFNPLVKIQKKQ